ncbi:MAG: DNA alkylation repair protein [Proteobacteria bacterium]|uniref:DNA alkylation repair protein n=1 Tax=Candidatus Avisuccinivibrio stercorigallinarum TaxID=2840704 RepID=A0A9D9GSF5_9GAMM|nr:DNA alkylation repair protein [Candidatus Avisuccinivibrio stercorigallinarum]
MAEALKDQYYSSEFVQDLARRIKAARPDFQEADFVQAVLDEGWNQLALKARTRHITLCLRRFLPQDYPAALTVLDEAARSYSQDTDLPLYNLMIFPDFVEVFGQDDKFWQRSMQALENYTKLSSSEFAVRPFILKDPGRMMSQMKIWAQSDNEHVRRLASEGSRPRLPWSMQLKNFIADPRPTVEILDQLRTDPSLYVRKSVANHLNDISKDHPALALETARRWLCGEYSNEEAERVRWIVKHGLRTLLKRGDKEALKLFGLTAEDNHKVKVQRFVLTERSISIGEKLHFSVELKALDGCSVRLEYQLGWVDAKGGTHQKVFQLGLCGLKAGESCTISKALSFAPMTTRRHHLGRNTITIKINGQDAGCRSFYLRAN